MLRKRLPKTPADRPARKRRVVLDLSATPDSRASPGGPIHEPPVIEASLGEALRAERMRQGLTLEAIAAATRVRRPYLEAIEDMRLDALPSRPFTIGYIRAYASALGLEPERVVERFRVDEPVLDEPLRAPVGVLDERDPRVGMFLVGALVIIAAIVLWNVAQRSLMANAPPPALASEAVTAKALAQIKPGAITLGAPLPAPVESTTPPSYETPGMAEAMGLTPVPTTGDRERASKSEAAVELASLPKTFVPAGRVYDVGNPQIASIVTLQALKPASLIIRGADGSVYFARQLSKGEAFKVPQLAAITLDVSKAGDLQVFVYGQSRGVLPSEQVLASKLATAPPAATAAKAP